MPRGPAQEIFLADEAATAELGRRLAQSLRPGDLVLLSGELGSGKTALARAAIRTLMEDLFLDVPSPSFSLVQPYLRDGQAILHADLYRLSDAAEVAELGLFDDPEAIVFVEWPERASGLLARGEWAVTLAIPPGGAGRSARVEAPAGWELAG
jgi:tRNA threonylcarbamoyl adenosine modification protein YjeE